MTAASPPSDVSRSSGWRCRLRRVVRAWRRLDRHVLYWFFRFDRWHLGHPDEAYVRPIVDFLNRRPAPDRRTIVEIGCGLGDILRRVRFRSRLGLDRDSRAVAAARVLAAARGQRALAFRRFEFPDSPLEGRYDAIVLVNWIHQVPPDLLGAMLQTYFTHNLLPGGVMVVDTVTDPAYTYNHDIRRLAPTGSRVEHLGAFARGRDVWALVKPSEERAGEA